MISFRFHIVSLTAVFLALAIGIGIGATVVDQATVNQIDKQLKSVKKRADSTNDANDQLRADLELWNRFASQGEAALLRGRLDAPVLLVGFQGIDRKPVEALRQSLVTAGARVEGTVWFTSKLKLANPEDVRSLQAVLGVASARVDVLRKAAATRVAESMVPGEVPSALGPLRDTGFVEFEAPSGEPVDLATVPAAGSLFVVASSAHPDVANDQLALPFTTALVPRAINRVLAVDSGRNATASQPAERAVFVRPLREDANLSPKLSTLDNFEEIRGRIAAVLALAALVEGKPGHFGVGPGAKRLVPEVAPAP